MPKQHDEDDIQLEAEEEVVAESKQSDKLKQLRAELKQANDERQEYLTGWQTARAELVNYKKQQDQANVERIKFANAGLIEDLLPALDSFEMAMGNTEAWQAVDENWRIGVEYIHTQLVKGLEDNGMSTIKPAAGDAFEPEAHEPIETIVAEDQKQADQIAELVQTGYRLNNRVLRPAKVKVYKLSE